MDPECEFILDTQLLQSSHIDLHRFFDCISNRGVDLLLHRPLDSFSAVDFTTHKKHFLCIPDDRNIRQQVESQHDEKDGRWESVEEEVKVGRREELEAWSKVPRFESCDETRHKSPQ